MQVSSSTPKSSYKHLAVNIKSPITPEIQPIMEETPIRQAPHSTVQQIVKVEAQSTTPSFIPTLAPTPALTAVHSYTRENLVSTTIAKPTYVRDKYQSEGRFSIQTIQ